MFSYKFNSRLVSKVQNLITRKYQGMLISKSKLKLRLNITEARTLVAQTTLPLSVCITARS
jgi:hypothetical protein